MPTLRSSLCAVAVAALLPAAAARLDTRSRGIVRGAINVHVVPHRVVQ